MIALAKGIATLETFPTGFRASVIVPNGAVSPFAIAPIAAFSHSHATLLAGFAAYNTAAIPMMYLLGRDLFGRRAGLIAAALFAANPWLIVFGRWLQPNALIAPTAVFFLWALHRALRGNSIRAWAVAGVAGSLSLQTHLSSLPNGIALLGLVPVSRALSMKGVAVAAGLAFLTMVPWVVGSVWPALTSFDPASASRSPGWSLGSLLQASRVATGGAYRAIVDAPFRDLDGAGPPFSWLDLTAQGLALLGWGYLVVLGWSARTRRPALSATCLVAALMVALPIVLLLRPPETGNVALLYVHEFINVAPALILAMAGVATAFTGRYQFVVSSQCIVIVVGQLVLAVAFYRTPSTEWHLGDFSIPYRFTGALVDAMREQATPTSAPVMVGGEAYAEQGKLAQTLLRLDYGLTRLHDGRDGIVLWADAPAQVLVTTRDQHSMSRFLRRDFAATQVFEQEVPGTPWTRRVFSVPSADLDRWAGGNLSSIPRTDMPSVVTYERAALLPPLAPGDGPTLAALWRFASEPTDPFFTDVVLLRAGQELYRERHVAYPIAFWEPGDWQHIRLLNLFDLPPSLDSAAVTEVRLEHLGILSGRRSVPSVSFSPVGESRGH